MLSKIKSFDKNPVKKGNPHRHNNLTATLDLNKGIDLAKLNLFRNSWPLSKLWIKTPDPINKEALNKAWQSKWKKQKKIRWALKDTTINPNCLNVEYAISFFISHSITAIIPANTIVIMAKLIKNGKNSLIDELKRTIKYTPAVTSVEEWTRDETGVGAAIAAGNQEEKGTWALLVINVTPNIVLHKIGISFKHTQSITERHDSILTEIKKKTSPTRFIKKVNIPATDLETLE